MYTYIHICTYIYIYICIVLCYLACFNDIAYHRPLRGPAARGPGSHDNDNKQHTTYNTDSSNVSYTDNTTTTTTINNM